MALGIQWRPQGSGLGTGVAATIVDGGGVALVHKVAHGIVGTSAYVYITSDYSNYNGWFIPASSDADNFGLVDKNGSFVDFLQGATITYYPVSFLHGWNCVHLPIMYTIASTLYPTNSVDNITNVISQSNDNGYTKLALSGTLGTFNELQFVKITGGSIPGIYQIINVFSNALVTINLAFSGLNTLSGATCQLYRSNYHAVINVYAGLNASHPWAAQKPYELAATLQITPDSDNLVKFSIADILKSYLNLRNNTLLGTLPNNLDFFTQFYISTAESYDQSDGYTITTLETSFTSDQSNFEGVAAQAKLEFKNQFSGYLTPYVMNSNTAKFLTLFAIPALFACSDQTPDCFQDVSFINDSESVTGFQLVQQYYKNGVLQATDNNPVVYTGRGLYRAPIDNPSCSYDRVDITLKGQYTAGSDLLFAQEAGNGAWTNIGGTYPLKFLLGATGTGRIVYVPLDVPAGTIQVNGTANNFSNSTGTIQAFILDANLNIIGSGTPAAVTNGSSFGGVGGGNITIATAGKYLAFQAVYSSGASMDLRINYSVANADGSTPLQLTISETKTFTIDCGCSPKDMRLTWLNNLGGFDYWNFHTPLGGKEYTRNIDATDELKQNLFPDWPNSYGTDADTINKQTYRDSSKGILVRSQYCTQAQLEAIAHIKSSPLVQIINSKTDRRTVIVDKDSFTLYKDEDKLYSIQFNINFTDNIPSQKT